MAQYMRTYKHALRKNILRFCANKREAIAACPSDIDKVHWAKFVDNEYADKKINQCKSNAVNRGKNIINHSLGRKNYGQLDATIAKQNPGASIKRSTAWKLARTRKNGEVLPSALEKYKQVQTAEEKRQTGDTSGNASSGIFCDFPDDELTEVFGPDKKKYCLAMGSSKKKIVRSIASTTIVEQKCATKIEDLRVTLRDDMKNLMKDAIKELLAAVSGMQNQAALPPNAATPITEGASNTLGTPSTPKDLSHPFGVDNPVEASHGPPNITGKNVMLLSGEKKK